MSGAAPGAEVQGLTESRGLFIFQANLGGKKNIMLRVCNVYRG